MSIVTVVTGAGAGIGSEICRILLERGETVIGCPRRPGSETLAALSGGHPDRFHEVRMDVSDDASIEQAVAEIESRVDHVDRLFNNAGFYPKKEGGLTALSRDTLGKAFQTNAIGPLKVTAALLPLLRKGNEKRLAQITSLMGSITDNTSGRSYSYRLSKTALNMAVKNLAHELGHEGFIALAIHPGWVQTNMGGSMAPLPLGPASEEVLRIVLEATPDQNGAFLGPGGKVLPF